jgi:hypothetical protein
MPLDLGSGAFFCLQRARRQNGMSTILATFRRDTNSEFTIGASTLQERSGLTRRRLLNE